MVLNALGFSIHSACEALFCLNMGLDMYNDKDVKLKELIEENYKLLQKINKDICLAHEEKYED